MNTLKRTISSKPGIILLLVIILIAVLCWTNKDRISNNFAEQLFKYPPPPQTKVIEKEQVNGKYLVAGVAGYWGVIASVRFSTKLSEEEILFYYQKAGLFKYPKSDKRGIQPEIYFQGDFHKVEKREGHYYTTKEGGRNPMEVYFDKEGKRKKTPFTKGGLGEEIEYVVQITGAFDYFLNKKIEYID